MTINEIQDELIDDFELFDDWEGKYEYIIDLGKKLPHIAESLKTESSIIQGCQSKVWLHAKSDNGKVVFEADSEAVIVRGLVAMLVKVLSNQPANEIAQADLYFMERIGLQQHLAQTRANGLAAMVKQMKLFALALNEL